MKFLKKLVLSAFFVSSLLATSANAGDCKARLGDFDWSSANIHTACLLYTSPSPRDRTRSRMPSSA